MISWSAVNSRDEHDASESQVTKEGVEHSLRSLYEEAIEKMSLSSHMGDTEWIVAREYLQEIISRLSDLEDERKRQRLGYLSLNNMSRMKETEGDFRGAMEDALSALELSLAANDTALLTRIALLSLKVGDNWTCDSLLFSGRLSGALSSSVSEISRRWTLARAQPKPLTSSDCCSDLLTRHTTPIYIFAIGNVCATSGLSVALRTWTAQLVRAGETTEAGTLTGAALVGIVDAAGSNGHCVLPPLSCVPHALVSCSDGALPPSPPAAVTARTHPSAAIDPTGNTDVSTNGSAGGEGPQHQGTNESVAGKRSCSDTFDDSTGGDEGACADGQTRTSSSTAGDEKTKKRRKSTRQVVKKLRDGDFDYGATMFTSGLAARGGGADMREGLWDQFQSALNGHFEVGYVMMWNVVCVFVVIMQHACRCVCSCVATCVVASMTHRCQQLMDPF